MKPIEHGAAQEHKVFQLAGRLPELCVACLALVFLLAAQWSLTSSIHGANYYGFDGKMSQGIILAALKYGGWFNVTDINPIAGVGSQILTMNVWANPAYWPFALFGRETALDISALVALAVFMSGCYVMARCFDVPVVPAAIAAQLCIILFGPAVLILGMPTNFCITPGNAVVYAPYMAACGLLARIEPGSWPRFATITACIIALLLYSLYADPLWSVVAGFCWALAFAIVTFIPLSLRFILLKMAALACYSLVLVLSGAAGYLQTLSQYTTRVQYPALVDRPRTPPLVSILFSSSEMKTLYVACAIGLLLGLLTLRGRPRVLTFAATISLVGYAAYSTVYLLVLNAVWIPPVPMYLEHGLVALYLAGAVAGYWGAVQKLAWIITPPKSAEDEVPASALFGFDPIPHRGLMRGAVIFVAVILVLVVPARIAYFVRYDAAALATAYYRSPPDEPELMQLFARTLSSDVGQPLRGAIHVWDVVEQSQDTLANIWAHGLHTIDEYSQLVTPQATYFLHAVLEQSTVLGSLNGFVPYPAGPPWERFARVLQMFGTRYYAIIVDYSSATGLPSITLPRRSYKKDDEQWYVYELPRPNVGNYSPTEIITTQSVPEIVEKMRAADFDFTRQAVLAAPIGQPLVAARDMRMVRVRGGFRVSGHSDGTSLVVLPLQFSHCLRARDPRVRFMRVNLMMAGMIFSGDVDTEIRFDYGMLSPGCRRVDLAEFKQMDMKIDLRMPHLTGDRVFPGWSESIAKLRDAGAAMKLW
jgi:hypothetical protein